ncbi:hypothetical protein NDU88_002818 [Pleurodeles waltl]|uniref:Uncharacterized protein n=1 Tax=Pleurodeles waltl TaxID=8319 RepID=A0AAV7M1Q9_PLEWA|nr:hypothetical protein NDU88_002818 [Pleurodeles waltl]
MGQEEGSGAAVGWAARDAAQRCIRGAGKRAQPCLKTCPDHGGDGSPSLWHWRSQDAALQGSQKLDAVLAAVERIGDSLEWARTSLEAKIDKVASDLVLLHTDHRNLEDKTERAAALRSYIGDERVSELLRRGLLVKRKTERCSAEWRRRYRHDDPVQCRKSRRKKKHATRPTSRDEPRLLVSASCLTILVAVLAEWAERPVPCGSSRAREESEGGLTSGAGFNAAFAAQTLQHHVG